MKNIWYNYIIENKELWPPKFTLKRLERIKDKVLSDDYIMSDLLLRHGAETKTPQQMQRDDKSCFDHCIGNLVLNILWKMKEEKLIKV